jgi:predicted nucleic acid-binding protein
LGIRKEYSLNPKSRNRTPDMFIETINAATFYFETEQSFSGSPDPKDNFLFNLAIQTGSELIASEEKILLNWQESPVPVHNITWFKENFFIDIPL